MRIDETKTAWAWDCCCCVWAIFAGLTDTPGFWSAQLSYSLRLGLSAGGQDVAGCGGGRPIVLCQSASQCFDQGQWVGRCRIDRRWGRASRAGTVIILRRSVDPRARVCWSSASTPAACRRLWAIAAHKTQAELAPKRPEGRWARGPSMRTANTVSMMAWWRWVMSACSTGASVLVKNG